VGFGKLVVWTGYEFVASCPQAAWISWPYEYLCVTLTPSSSRIFLNLRMVCGVEGLYTSVGL